MAQGDVKAGVASIAGLSWWTIQPPVGEHWLVKRIFSNRLVGTSPDIISDVGFALFDGAIHSFLGYTNVPEQSIKLYQQELNIGVNNTIYFRLRNAVDLTAGLGYSAIQIK